MSKNQRLEGERSRTPRTRSFGPCLGVDAGWGSERAVNGRWLTRRTTVGQPEQTTAEPTTYPPEDGTVLSQPNSSSTVPISGASGGGSSTTRTGTTRKKWTDDEYSELLWCYFYCIHSSFPKSGYEARMHAIWLQRNPEKQFTKL
jgi:hypothetical protein